VIGFRGSTGSFQDDCVSDFSRNSVDIPLLYIPQPSPPTTHGTPKMTSSSTEPIRSNLGYNDPPDDIFGDGHGLKGKGTGKTRGFLVAQDEEDVDQEPGRSLLEEDASNQRKPPKQPRSRRLNNSSVSSSNHNRDNSRDSSMTDPPELNGGPSTSKASRGNRYPAHSSIPTQTLGSSSTERRPPNHIRHLSESLGKEIHALEHEFEDTLFRGTESDRRTHHMASERDEYGKHHLDDQSMEMEAGVDEETLRAMRRSRYIRSAAVTGIFVLLW
jgi:hypothetical protein